MAKLTFEKLILSNLGRKRYLVFISFEPVRNVFTQSKKFVQKVLQVLKIKYPDEIEKLDALEDHQLLKLYFSGYILLKDDTTIGKHVEGSIMHMLFARNFLYSNHLENGEYIQADSNFIYSDNINADIASYLRGIYNDIITVNDMVCTVTYSELSDDTRIFAIGEVKPEDLTNLLDKLEKYPNFKYHEKEYANLVTD